AVERNLDVHFVVGAVDAGAIVDEVGVDAAATVGELDPSRLGDGEVRPLPDDLCAKFGSTGAERVVGQVADIGLRLARRLDVCADAAEPEKVDGCLEDGIDQAGR